MNDITTTHNNTDAASAPDFRKVPCLDWLDTELRVYADRTDDRRNKVYHVNVTVSITGAPHPACRAAVDKNRRALDSSDAAILGETMLGWDRRGRFAGYAFDRLADRISMRFSNPAIMRNAAPTSAQLALKARRDHVLNDFLVPLFGGEVKLRDTHACGGAVNVSADLHADSKTLGRHALRLHFRLVADKPSKLLTADEIKAQVAESDLLARLQDLAINETLHAQREYLEEVRADENIQVVAWALDRSRDKAVKDAKAIVRYEQRLAALNAEYAAEVEVQASVAIEATIADLQMYVASEKTTEASQLFARQLDDERRDATLTRIRRHLARVSAAPSPSHVLFGDSSASTGEWIVAQETETADGSKR